MGAEIGGSAFSEEARAEFQRRLRDETKTLKRWFDERRFTYSEGFTGGLEVEAWLVDENALPAPEKAAEKAPAAVPQPAGSPAGRPSPQPAPGRASHRPGRAPPPPRC